MLKTLRSNTKWIMIVVSVAFVAMMVFAWGMDITGSRGMRPGVVGSVNGRDITWAAYDEYLKNQRQNMTTDTRNSTAQERQLHDQVWEQMVTQMLVQQDIKTEHISFTDEELIDFMMNNPFQGADQVPDFKDENGTFSIDKYRAFMQNPENLNNPEVREFIRSVEAQAESMLPSFKLQQRITNGARVSDADVRERWLADNETRNATWVFLATSDLPNVASEAAPDTVRAYFDEHKENYRTGERRIIAAVFFPLQPTSADTTDVLDRAKVMVERLRSGEDFAELANSYSDDPGNAPQGTEPRGGDLGFFTRERMVEPFAGVAFSMKPGEISDPVLTRFGYHIIKVDSIRTGADGAPSEVKARHILMIIEPSRETADAVNNRVTAFYETVSGGADFVAQSQLDSLQVMTSPPFKAGTTFVPGVNINSALLANRIFDAKRNEVIQPVFTDNGYFVIQVTDIRPAGIPPFEEVARQVEMDWQNSVRAEAAKTFIDRVDGRMKAGIGLAEAVQADTTTAAPIHTDIVTRRLSIPGLGTMSPLVARIFELTETGASTGPVMNPRGAGIAVLNEILPVDEARFEQEKESLRESMLSELQQELLNQYLQNLRVRAKIKDYRYKFYSL